MSRIDEALKRASHSPLAGRGHSRGTDAPLRLADEFTLNEYPQETRDSKGSSEPGSVRADHAAVVHVRSDSRLSQIAVHLESNSKLVVGRECAQPIIEQYRRLAATLHEAQVEKGLKTIIVTSAVPQEGKTLTAVNLALTLSESYGRRVLLIDADLRRPSLHTLFGIPNQAGLSEVLKSESHELPLVQVSSNCSLLLSGRTERNPLAGLSSPRMRSLLDDVASKYDWILLDTPPVGLLPDSQILAHLTQAALFVIRAGETPYEVVEKAMGELGRDCIIGTVLNAIDENAVRPARYGYGYYSRSQ